MTSHETRYTIGELARRAGVTPRTVRYYTAEGLLPPPETRGRYALYGEDHLLRLALIAQLKASYLPLSAIKARLEQHSPHELGQMLADTPTELGAAPNTAAATTAGRALAEQGEEYLTAPNPLMLRPRPAGGGAVGAQPQLRAAGEPATEGIYQPPAPLQLGRVEFFPAKPEPLVLADDETSEAQNWQRVRLAPGVELHVFEGLSAHKRRKLAALIAAARDALADDEE